MEDSSGGDVTAAVEQLTVRCLIPAWREAAGGSWHEPHLANCEHHEEGCAEWWNGSRKLAVFVTGGNASGLRVWGPHMWNDMADFDPLADFSEAWAWLMEESCGAT